MSDMVNSHDRQNMTIMLSMMFGVKVSGGHSDVDIVFYRTAEHDRLLKDISDSSDGCVAPVTFEAKMLPRGQRDQPRQSGKKSAFASTIGAMDDSNFRAVEFDRDVIKDGLPRQTDRSPLKPDRDRFMVMEVKHGHSASRRPNA